MRSKPTFCSPFFCNRVIKKTWLFFVILIIKIVNFVFKISNNMLQGLFEEDGGDGECKLNI
jgi:hypothetical protein